MSETAELIRRFEGAAVAAGCTVEHVRRRDVGALDLAENAVIAGRAAERYPELATRTAQPAATPLVSYVQGVVAADMGVAESGSVLVVETELADRLVSMMAEDLVVIVEERDIADRLDAATAWLEAQRPVPPYVVLLTGPSRTADIERSLTIGVQGPSATRLVLVGESS